VDAQNQDSSAQERLVPHCWMVKGDPIMKEMIEEGQRIREAERQHVGV
jgi:hypothetical protein